MWKTELFYVIHHSQACFPNFLTVNFTNYSYRKAAMIMSFYYTGPHFQRKMFQECNSVF